MKRMLMILMLLPLLATAQYVEYEQPAAKAVIVRPAALDSTKKSPVLFLLHGIGERGNGSLSALTKLKVHTNYSPAETFAKQYGFIIIEPQTTVNWQYGEVDNAYAWAKDSLGHYINWKKAYIAGQSLGGGGVHRYLSSNPNAHLKFAAAAPTGSGPNQFFVTSIANLVNTKVPYWAFHNRGDAVVTPAQSTLLVRDEWIKRKGTAKMWFSIHDLDGHTFPAFNRGKGNTLSDGLKYVTGYTTPMCNLYEWFLMNEIGKPAVAPPVLKVITPLPAPGTPRDTATAPTDTVSAPVKDTTAPVKPVAPKISGVTHSFGPGTAKTFVVEVFYSDKTKQLIKAPTGDRILSSYWSETYNKLTVVFEKAGAKVFGTKF